MLEHATLLLRPPDSSGARAVVDPAGGASLGFVRRRPRGWLERRLRGALLEVREQEDESLLFTIRHSRIRPQSHFVYEAEDHYVGAVRGRRLEDRHGRVLANRRPDAERKGEVLRDPEGRALATLLPEPEGIIIAFTEAAVSDPFTRMLVLAAAL